jgi:hypothetical protein
MEFLSNFPAYWKEASIVVAGVAAALSIFWEVKDKQTKKITGWGRIFLGITVVSMLGALFAQVLENKDSDARNKKAQDEALQLLTHTRQGILELSRLLQPLDQPTVTLFIDLSCGLPAYEAFCSSAQAQSDEAFAAHQKVASRLPPGSLGSSLPPGSSFGGGEKFDWSKWPNTIGPISFMHLHLFKTKKEFEQYADGQCLNCAEAGDFTLSTFVTSESFSPSFLVTTDKIWVHFLAVFKEMKPSVKRTTIMSVPDLEGAVISIYDPLFFEVLTPTTIFIDTPRGQRIVGKFQVRETRGEKVYFAEFSKE